MNKPKISINMSWLVGLYILLHGEPDIIDAIIHWLMTQ